MKRVFEMDLQGKPLRIETGEIALFSNGSCVVIYGDTVILSTVTANKPRPGTDFFPLSVDYEEKMYSVGKFPGGFLKREGRPTENAVLTARAIDRQLRPLFPDDLRNDVHVNNLVMSVDEDCQPEIAAMIGSSIAVAISDIPWHGPTASVSLGLVDGEIIINPTAEQREVGDMEVTLSGSEEKVVMIEAGANEVKDELMLEAIVQGHKVIQDICRFIKGIVTEIGRRKFEYESFKLPEDVYALVRETGYDRVRESILSDNKSVRDAHVAAVAEQVTERINEVNPDWLPYMNEAMDQLQKEVVRDYLFKDRQRVDGRAMDEIRPLSAQVGLLPHAHGSALFQRGQTQAITITTLAPLSKVQKIDGLDENIEYKRYLHHYNFPGYSVGEAKMSRSPGRREIGHGALAERSLVYVLPSEEDFPYAIRNVSEITMSNGSTSQASVCASTLALMDAGVPIRRPVAGISSGLITNPEDENDFMCFMDIQGIEDFYGDMDFKVAGTVEGITGIQVDIKTDGLSYDVIEAALAMTKKGRLQIINDVMIPLLAEPRKELSPWAPKITSMSIPPEKIGEVVGKQGKVINAIIADTGTEINIEDDGSVYISGIDQDGVERALEIIKGIVTDPEPGQVYVGRVTRLMNFGAFVEYLPGKEGLVHISKMSWDRVDKVEDVVSVGDTVTVKVLELDRQGRINLSIRDCLPKPEDWVEPERDERSNRPRGGRDRRSGSGGGRSGGSDRRDGGGRRDSGGGPSGGGDRRESGHFRD